jgi:tetratricopeptide (TPR) repeat protein
MPPRSSISRLAMKIGGSWREAEAAETSAARQTYEAIIHRRRDPLLVEQPREREIAARIAPIFGSETKEVQLEYTSEVGPQRPIVVPLRGLPAVGHLEVSIVDGATEPVHLETSGEKPAADVRYALPATVPNTVRSGDFIATRIEANVATEPQPLAQAVYLVDTSASADLDAAEALLAALPKAPVIAYDLTAEYLPNPAVDLRARGALGLANLGSALELAAKSGAKRIVVLGGGTAASAPAVERIDILGTTPTVDARALRPIARNGAIIEDATRLSRADLLHRLEHRVQDAPISIPGATWTSASVLKSASPGEERVVFARVPAVVDDLHDPVIDHAAAAAKVEALVAADSWTEATKKEAITLARAHRLSTPFTSLIVLETDNDVSRLRWTEAHGDERSPPPAAPRGRVTKPVALRMGATMVSGRLPPEVIQRIVRLNVGAFQGCYRDGQRRDPHLAGRVVVKFVIERDGSVTRAQDAGSEIKDRQAIECMVQAFARLQYPQPEGGVVTVVYPFVFSQDEEPAGANASLKPMALNPMQNRRYWSPFQPSLAMSSQPWSEAYAEMRETPSRAPRTPVGFVALGASLEAKGDRDRAARAYASLAELWPERAELARAAAVRLDHLRPGDPLAIQLLRRAAADRPDQPSSHHLLGLTLLRAGDREGARKAFQAGAERRYELRYAGSADLLRADLALLEPSTVPLNRLSLAWETDTSDLELLVTNDEGARAALASIAASSDGYGPEAADAPPFDEPVHVQVALHHRGMGGDVLGAVHVIKRNARREVTIDVRPFEMMTENSRLDLGGY